MAVRNQSTNYIPYISWHSLHRALSACRLQWSKARKMHLIELIEKLQVRYAITVKLEFHLFDLSWTVVDLLYDSGV